MAALGWRSLGAVASVLTWHMPAEVFAAPGKRTMAPTPTKEPRVLQQYSNYDVIKAKTFKKSGATFREVFKKFGVPERTLRRMMAEDQERGQLGKPSCPSQVIHQLREEVKVATKSKMVTPTVELKKHPGYRADQATTAVRNQHHLRYAPDSQ